MTTELTILAYAALLQVAQLSLTILFGDIQTGLKYGASARDTPRPLHGFAGRLNRALDNHYAALLMFAITVMIVTLGDKSSALTVTCAWAYLFARIAYVPAYAFGIPYVRSAIWSVSAIATLIMLIQTLI